VADENLRPSTERHIQTIITGAVLLLLAWNFFEVQSQSVKMATIVEKTASIEKRLDFLGNFMGDRYTASDAKRDFRVRDSQISEIKGRLDRLERNAE
jgi:hypothetical protein